MAEVYAGFLSHVDHHIGRLLDYLEESGQLDNTIVVLVSDNGASGEGGPNGSVNENKFFNGDPGQDRGQPALPRQARQPGDVQPLPDRLGLGVQHAVQDVEALQLRGWHRRPVGHLVAEGHQGPRRDPPPVQPRDRHRADDLRLPRHRAAGRGQGLHADPARGPELPLQLRGRRRADREGDRLLHDARLAGHLAQGLEGRRRPSDHRRLGRLRQRPLGVVRHDQGPDGDDRPGCAVPGEGPGTRQPVVLAGRHVQGPADRRPDRRSRSSTVRARRCRSHATATSTTRTAPRSPSSPRSMSGIARTRRRGGDGRHAGGERRPVLARRALRRALAVHQGRQAQVRLQLRRHVRPGGRVRRRPSRPASTSSRRPSSARAPTCRPTAR